jgi:hypothetical protein
LLRGDVSLATTRQRQRWTQVTEEEAGLLAMKPGAGSNLFVSFEMMEATKTLHSSRVLIFVGDRLRLMASAT